MKTIVLLYHSSDNKAAKALRASLGRMLDSNQFHVWTRDSRTAYDDAFAQLEDAIQEAFAVLVFVGPQGVDEELQNLAKGPIQQRILEDGRRVGRLRLHLVEDDEPPQWLKPWVPIVAADQRVMAETVLEKLKIKPQWSEGLALDKAAEGFEESKRREMRRHLAEVAHGLADGKPLTLLIGPYAAVEGPDDGSCPSRVRQALIDFIDDDGLKNALAPLHMAAEAGAIPPLLWQDYLATLCILSGRTRDQIADVIGDAVGEAPGDARGKPQGLFKAIANFVMQIRNFDLPRNANYPAVTILTVCPGLRMERALIARGIGFERVTLLFSGAMRPEVNCMTYDPSPQKRYGAAAGEEFFMPEGVPRAQADGIEFVRLVKLAGSRDLFKGITGGDLGQNYDLMGELRPHLQDFVAAAGAGPYLVLGGGLSTPPMQAAHAVLLRGALEKIAPRPCLAVVPPSNRSPDLLRKIEDGRTTRLTQVTNSGFDRLKIVSVEPVKFIEALSVAFGSEARPEAA